MGQWAGAQARHIWSRAPGRTAGSGFPGQSNCGLPQCTWSGSPTRELGSEWALLLARPECRPLWWRGAGPWRKEPQWAWSGLDGCLHGTKSCPEAPFVPESGPLLARAPLASSASSLLRLRAPGHRRTEAPAWLPTAVPLTSRWPPLTWAHLCLRQDTVAGVRQHGVRHDSGDITGRLSEEQSWVSPTSALPRHAPATARIPGSGVTGSAAWAFAFLARVAGKGLVLSHDAVFPNQEKEPASRRCGRQPFSCPGHPELGSAVGPACAHASLPCSRDSRPLTRPDVA